MERTREVFELHKILYCGALLYVGLHIPLLWRSYSNKCNPSSPSMYPCDSSSPYVLISSLQVLYKETVVQWIVSGTLFLLIFAIKFHFSISLIHRYGMLLPVFNTHVSNFLSNISIVQKGYISLYEIGFIPEGQYLFFF